MPALWSQDNAIGGRMFRALSGSLLLVSLCWSAMALPVSAQTDSGKARIAVLPLKGEGRGTFGDQRDEVYQKVTQAFFVTKRFDLMERAQLKAVLGEGKLQSSGLVDDATAVSLGKQLGVKFVVLGSYNGSMDRIVESFMSKTGPVYNVFFPAKITLNLRMVNVESGKIEEAFEATGASKAKDPTRGLGELMRDVSIKLNREVANKFPVTGYLIKVLNEKEAIIDLGKKDGVVEGDVFTLVERGEDIVHPVTGKVIKGSKRVLSELKVTTVDDETSTVKISGTKVPLKVGLILESAPKKAGFWESLNDSMKK
jgi:Curli production assembly/transport component CsgG